MLNNTYLENLKQSFIAASDEKKRKLLADVILDEQRLKKENLLKEAADLRQALIKYLMDNFRNVDKELTKLADQSANELRKINTNATKNQFLVAQQNNSVAANKAKINSAKALKAQINFNAQIDRLQHNAWYALNEFKNDDKESKISNTLDVLTATELINRLTSPNNGTAINKLKIQVQDYSKYMNKHHVKACRNVGIAFAVASGTLLSILVVGVVVGLTVSTFGIAPIVAAGVAGGLLFAHAATGALGEHFYSKAKKDKEISLAIPMENIAKRM